MKLAFMTDLPERYEQVYVPRRPQIEKLGQVLNGFVTSDQIESRAAELRDVRAIFATWGMPRLTAEQLDLLPNLEIVFYAASSIKGFAPPLLDRGITVVSGWSANAVPVAEFTLSQTLLALKGFFRNVHEYRQPEIDKDEAFRGKGVYGATVALIGYGQVARHLRKMLRGHALNVLVVDPFLGGEEAAKEDVERVTMAEAFARADVVSNHLPALPETRRVITGEHFRAMPADATFINTGRGMSVNEDDLVDVFGRRPDLTALLDVTDPEPVPPDSPLWALPNVVISSHIAGSIGDEVLRIVDWLIDEFIAWRDGRPLRFAIRREELAHMA